MCPYINMSQIICVDDIITKTPDASDVIGLLQNMCAVAYYTQVLLENTKCNADVLNFVSENVQWLSVSCYSLAEKIKQPVCKMQKKSSRSSYNFCTRAHNCQDMYSAALPKCRQHHFVWGILYRDLCSIQNLISIRAPINSIYLTMKTCCFVLRHSFIELCEIQVKYPAAYQQYHRNNLQGGNSHNTKTTSTSANRFAALPYC